MSNIIEAKDSDFESKVINTEGLVLVDFWADWCGPCKTLAPVIDAYAEENDITVVKFDVDNNTEIPTKYGVRGIPTMILFKNGRQVATKVGSVTKAQLASFIQTNS